MQHWQLMPPPIWMNTLGVLWSRFWFKLDPPQTTNVWRVRIIRWSQICCKMYDICESVHNKLLLLFFLFQTHLDEKNTIQKPLNFMQGYSDVHTLVVRHALLLSSCLFTPVWKNWLDHIMTSFLDASLRQRSFDGKEHLGIQLSV